MLVRGSAGELLLFEDLGDLMDPVDQLDNMGLVELKQQFMSPTSQRRSPRSS